MKFFVNFLIYLIIFGAVGGASLGTGGLLMAPLLALFGACMPKFRIWK